MKVMKKKPKRELTEMQERFVVEYATTANAKQSAINAGYSTKVASVVACKLLKSPIVSAMLQKIKDKDNRKFELTRERVLGELAKGLFRDPIGMEDAQGFVVTRLSDIPPELRAIIDGFKVTQDMGPDEDGNIVVVRQRIEVKLVPKASVQDMAMKHLGAYAAEKSENKVSVNWDELHGRSVITDPASGAIEEVNRRRIEQ